MAAAILTACGANNSGGSAAGTSTSTSTSSSAAATGSPSGGSGAAAAQSLTATEGDFTISLDPTALAPGAYAIQVVNDGNATHDLAIEQDGTKLAGSDKIGPGRSTTLEVTLEPGTYVFYCSIGNHRAMGMEQTVTVQ
jgi:plastocyanin